MPVVQTISRKPGRKIFLGSSETIRQAPLQNVGEDIVRTAWRHAEAGRNVRLPVAKESQRFVFSASSASSAVTMLSEIPCRVSSDLHEWRNNLGAVSTRGSAKL